MANELRDTNRDLQPQHKYQEAREERRELIRKAKKSAAKQEQWCAQRRRPDEPLQRTRLNGHRAEQRRPHR
ncbi:MAG: hypothetical protein E6H73_12220 [Betaproteobacteria bacterium]|nr:MAG: hypothetical protein E6H73_12220 [Betaproteobacteria bacterium]